MFRSIRTGSAGRGDATLAAAAARLRQRALCAMGVLAVGLALCLRGEEKPREADWQDRWRELAELGEGFVVWESRRSGSWRIWRRNLDGSGLRMLSPEEPGRDHFCPHLSPDGSRLLYISYPAGAHTYQPIPRGKRCPLHILGTDGSGGRVVVPAARAYFEDRAALWLSDSRFQYIGEDGRTYLHDLTTGRRTPLTRDGHAEYGFLLNPGLTHGVQGRPDFHVYDSVRKTLAPRRNLGGCQPYFTRDGRWGFWTGGAGGPLKRIHLGTGKVAEVIRKDDPRMPEGRRYLYFPMFSPCRRLFAFGASPNQHDHFRSDYDIFVCRSDPRTLELIGKPVRYSFHRDCDRFPDVFLGDVALGRHSGEIPLTLALQAPAPGVDWQWHIDGRIIHTGDSFRHTFFAAGKHEVTAVRGGRRLRGDVEALPARAPTVVSACRTGRAGIKVVFDEAVSDTGVEARLGSGTTLALAGFGPDGDALRLEADRDLADEETLILTGIRDRAQHPNRADTFRIRVTAPRWPPTDEGSVFAWQTASRPVLVPDPAGGAPRTYALRPRGRARLNHDQAMCLDGGAYCVEGADEALLRACRRSGEVTVEAVVRPDTLDQTGPARIVSFSIDSANRNLTLGQQGKDLVLRLRTPHTGTNGTNPEVRLAELAPGRRIHVMVTYGNGTTIAYVDGRIATRTDRIRGNFSNWQPMHLIFGDEWSGDRDWGGTLEGVALYARALSADEAATHAARYREVLAGRSAPPAWELEARLQAVSTVPDLAQIAPYREALIVSEYRALYVRPTGTDPAAEDRPEAPRPAERVRVLHWGMLDGERLPVSDVSPGSCVRLLVQRLCDNPQVASYYQSDTLPEDFDVRVFFAVGDAVVSAPPGAKAPRPWRR